MRTVVEIEGALLEAAQRELGTSTAKETVQAALAEIAERGRRRDAFEFWRTEGSPDLLDPQITKHESPGQD